ncbi:MAG: hypothetical protein COV31_03140 [Candidatus Yanofskybacteria bacterium CG10_big_fil_rev_8_21_14_0_10_46_23]|uniref:DOD-type homing endonuclease domain-containing protein n=1 Tax=Candidatus Yanofskybacteria bacterium CG10_big_fil_rev_8_21_14_0_10_46_23 TaxID=1975098 RepID=A0A2H0R3J8_9BACT|nr:MAG: hypothetical protein COV31_03140 [Candidatus Yanofskybacteria bacterium CG10_big_fil_rev_8_21_14_0_10_46_23]
MGDGNLSNPNGRAIRLRITCDKKYPQLIKNFQKVIKKVLPNNKISLIKRDGGCLDISCYSNKWPKILGWKPGPKASQISGIPNWIKSDKKYLTHCLKGLIETDGCIYKDRGYKMIGFTSTIENLSKDVFYGMATLGFKPRIYKVKLPKKLARFNVRLAKNVEMFINLVGPIKR